MSESESRDQKINRWEQMMVARILQAGKMHAEEMEKVGKCRDAVRRLEGQLEDAKGELMIAESRRDRVAALALDDVRAFPDKVAEFVADVDAEQGER